MILLALIYSCLAIPVAKDFNIQLSLPYSKNGEPRVINNINIIINVGPDAELESTDASQLTTEITHLETTAEIDVVNTPAEKIADNYDENLFIENFTTTEVPVQSSTSPVFTTPEKTEESTSATTRIERLSSTERVGAATTIRLPASTQSVSSTLSSSSKIESETSAITSIAPETSLPPPLGTQEEPENAILNPEYSTTTASIITDVITKAESGGKSSDDSASIPSVQIDIEDFQEYTTKKTMRVQTGTEKSIVFSSVATPALRLSTSTSAADINNNNERLEQVTNSTMAELNDTRASTIASLTSSAAYSSKAAEEIVNKTELSTVSETTTEVSQTELFTALPGTAESSEAPSAKANGTTEGERNGLIDTTASTSFSLDKDFRKLKRQTIFVTSKINQKKYLQLLKQ
ncbi:unnamed protein product [Oikopleura dioica]|uniref:Uncharacterized protein n=1 Tax=Oikopleura dioica TaxID=34765 RepID=E4Y5V7_OIKDI|nr:unnamed protein product [Oikopleura dioica]